MRLLISTFKSHEPNNFIQRVSEFETRYNNDELILVKIVPDTNKYLTDRFIHAYKHSFIPFKHNLKIEVSNDIINYYFEYDDCDVDQVLLWKLSQPNDLSLTYDQVFAEYGNHTIFVI